MRNITAKTVNSVGYKITPKADEPLYDWLTSLQYRNYSFSSEWPSAFEGLESTLIVSISSRELVLRKNRYLNTYRDVGKSVFGLQGTRGLRRGRHLSIHKWLQHKLVNPF